VHDAYFGFFSVIHQELDSERSKMGSEPVYLHRKLPQAMGTFREVGPGGHFLGCEHTKKNYLSAFHDSELTDTSSFEQWQTEGSLTTEQRANKIWKRMLQEYEVPALDPVIDEALQEFIRERRSATTDVTN
jgi:trimethylamine--corrinoid protein Co-methyltransferase